MNIARSLKLIALLPRRTVGIAQTHFRSINMATRSGPLNYQDGPLVWIDCEMTGLNPKHDKLLEIAVIITNGNLDAVDDGVEFVIKRDKSILDNMDKWCIEQHGKSGLTQACLESPHSKDDVSNVVLKYIKGWIPEKNIGVLAGSSVHADRAFLVEEMPDVVEWLHYRIVDVSSIKELHRRWYQATLKKSNVQHRALDDIKSYIRELAWYRENIFRAPELARSK